MQPLRIISTTATRRVKLQTRERENGTDALRSASLAIKNLFDDADHSVYLILLGSFYFLKPDSRVSLNQTRTKYEDKNPLWDKPWDNLSY